jgi:hypothetical protein
MRAPTSIVVVALATCTAGGTARAQARQQWVGIVQPSGGAGVCVLDGQTHQIDDVCEFGSGALESSVVDLDAWTCRYVQVEGPVHTVECTIMEVEMVTPIAPPCTDYVKIHQMRRLPAGGVRVSWQFPVTNFPCHDDTFDVIRGTLPVHEAGAVVDLGPVVCLSNDTTEKFAIDSTHGLAPGACWFYLVRPNGAPDFETYGASSSGSQRVPFSGDCARD